MKHSFYSGQREFVVAVEGKPSNRVFQVSLGAAKRQVAVLSQDLRTGHLRLLVDGVPWSVRITRATLDEIEVQVRGRAFTLRRHRQPIGLMGAPSAVPLRRRPSDDKTVVSAIPAKVVQVMVKPGDVVRRGDTLVVLESMKMEASVRADRGGIVKDVLVKEGGSTAPGQPLVVFE